MSDILKIVMEWPVIVQGALGSGLFWLTLLLGQKVFEKAWESYSKHSVKTRISWLTNRSGMIQLRLSKPVEQQSIYASLLLYRASRHLFRALMWLVLGLSLQLLFSPISLIGFLGCLYYLIEGYSIVKGTGEGEEELKQELQKIIKEIKTLKEPASNKSSKADAESRAAS
ncbi:hypothetical protein [Shewanella baltica]|uniref:hypothetical protein n=1 Tax=Shewanella baltica TaxID=62322 RepID=UPI00217ED2F4|nr:hypothetical protein [Shewanella baltica]MCS6192295.1 hypothetical protein [Shewanella baltica]